MKCFNLLSLFLFFVPLFSKNNAQIASVQHQQWAPAVGRNAIANLSIRQNVTANVFQPSDQSNNQRNIPRQLPKSSNQLAQLTTNQQHNSNGTSSASPSQNPKSDPFVPAAEHAFAAKGQQRTNNQQKNSAKPTNAARLLPTMTFPTTEQSETQNNSISNESDQLKMREVPKPQKMAKQRTKMEFGGENEVNAENTPSSIEGANTWHEMLNNRTAQRLLEQGQRLLDKLERNGTEERSRKEYQGTSNMPTVSNNGTSFGRITPQGISDGTMNQGTSNVPTVSNNGTSFGRMTPPGFSDTISTTTQFTTTATNLPTTSVVTTQDPNVRSEFEKADAPEILKIFIPPKPPAVPQEAKKIFEDLCAGGKCLVQKPEFIQQKAAVEKESEQIEQKLNPGKSAEQVKKEVKVRMAKTQQLKKALVQNAGLEGQVEPADNGVFGHDQLLTETQANDLLNELTRHKANRAKRAGNAMFLEATNTKRWEPSKAIPFMFDQSLAKVDKQSVRKAIVEIQSKTCLKFKEVKVKPTGSHLYYTKIANPTFCGLSYVGRVEPANPIYLSFMCGNPAGVAVHETMHALGFQHEQLRFDRDQFITIQWENVNPQQLDFFTVSDVTKFSSYGIKYDYGSIMQYASTIASSAPGKKTMVAKLKPTENERLMGQREGLSLSDVEAVKKMYCQPSCDDKIIFCGIWATMNLCDPRMWRRAVVHAWIVENCQKSCNKCGEKVQSVKGQAAILKLAN